MDSVLLRLDAFRKIPAELTNPTMHGAYLTVCAYAVMGLLFIMELHSYLTSNIVKTVDLDPHYADSIWIDFDVIMYELPCEYTHVVVRDIVGNNELDIMEQSVTKERTDVLSGAFKGVHEVISTDVNTKDGEDTAPTHIHDANPELESDWVSTSDHFHHSSFDQVLEYHDFTMINFYADWCIHCRRFAPTWKDTEQTTDKMHLRDKNRRETNAKLLRVNCVEFGEVCAQQGVRAYPTVRLYKRDKTYVQYKGLRKKEDIIKFLQDYISKETLPQGHTVVSHHSETAEGCRVHGELRVRRVPGYFLLEADSTLDSLEPAMTNVSHQVNHLWFIDDREALRDYIQGTESHITEDVLRNIHPMREEIFATWKEHQAPQHYLNVIPTIMEERIVAYQSSVQSITLDVEPKSVPQARFSYTFSPMIIKIDRQSRPFYDFLTSLFAIIGGTYTFISLVDKFWDTVSARYKKNIGRLD